jgi:hypothetical protein
MSSEDIPSRGHRQTRSATVLQYGTPPSQHPNNLYYRNSQAHTQNMQSEINYPSQPTTPPRTPRRDNQAQNTANLNTNGSKQKSRNNKNRPKNVMTSPAVKGNRDRTTPPLTGAQSAGIPSSSKPINTPSTAVYAGATFHASPAPSALPIPSFYSKSVPESPGLKGLKSVEEMPLSKTTESLTPPVAPSSGSRFKREESPLDFFFKADREEKARAHSASSTTVMGQVSGPFQPPPESTRHTQTPPASQSQYRPRHTSRTSASGMFAMELDGPSSPGAPFGPAFSTPYSERINAAKSTTTRSRDDSQSSLEKSEALKAYLFSGHTVSPPTISNAGAVGSDPSTPNPPYSLNEMRSAASISRPLPNEYSSAIDGRASNNGNKLFTRSSGLRQEVTPSKTPAKTPDRETPFSNSPTPSRIYGHMSPSNAGNFLGNSNPNNNSPSPALPYGVSSGNRSADLLSMEDSLRKILKLDSPMSSGVSEVGMQPTTGGVTQQYGGGRAPRYTGMGGVMRS